MKNISWKRLGITALIAVVVVLACWRIDIKTFFTYGEDVSWKEDLPSMAKVEVQPSPYGEDQALNFAPVFDITFTKGEDEAFWIEEFGEEVVFPGMDSFSVGVWRWDIPAGQVVLVVDIEKGTNYCRVLGVSLQGWDVDGWMRCDRLGPVW